MLTPERFISYGNVTISFSASSSPPVHYCVGASLIRFHVANINVNVVVIVIVVVVIIIVVVIVN